MLDDYLNDGLVADKTSTDIFEPIHECKRW